MTRVLMRLIARQHHASTDTSEDVVRDSDRLASTFDERDPAVTGYIRKLISTAQSLELKTSICGQAPSVHPAYSEFLVQAGIDSISVSMDAVDRTRQLVASAERRLILNAARRSLDATGSDAN